MGLLVTGSIGIDDVVTPHGAARHVIGGSALYFAWAAANFSDVRLVGVVGQDFPRELESVFDHPRINTAGLERRAGSKTFRWAGTYDPTMNEATTTQVDLNVLGEAGPKVPTAFADSRIVFLAATHPGLQEQLLAQIKSPELVVADTRDLWIRQFHKELIDALKHFDGLVLNDGEARLLTNQMNLVEAIGLLQRLLRPAGPRMVIIKKGEHGCLAGWGEEIFAMPAFPARRVIDPTGAGDSFAGGLLGYLNGQKQLTVDALKNAVIAGTVMASFTIEEFSLAGLRAATPEKAGGRIAAYKKMIAIAPAA